MSLASRERQAARERESDDALAKRHARQIVVQQRLGRRAHKRAWNEAIANLRRAIQKEHPEFYMAQIGVAVEQEIEAAQHRAEIAEQRAEADAKAAEEAQRPTARRN